MVYKYDNIIIGSSLEALLYSFNTGYPILFTEALRPFRFDYFSPDIDLSCVRIDNSPTVLKTFDQQKTIGVRKEILWERLFFLLSLSGQIITPNCVHSLRYRADDRIIVSNEYSKIAEVKFGTCHYFGDSSCAGMVKKKPLANHKYTCYDWVAFHRGGKHDIDYIKTADSFAHEIWFYPSDRIDGATSIKDACVVSYLTAEQLIDFDSSETMARFKLIHEMESRGMKGLFNGYSKNGTPKYYKFRTSGIARTKSEPKNAFKPQASNIQIPEDSEKSLLETLPEACVGYDRFLRWL